MALSSCLRPSAPLRALRFILPLLLVSSPAFSQPPPPTPTDFAVLPGHPRCVFRPADRPGGGRTFEQVRDLYAGDPVFRAIMDKALAQSPERQHAAANAACWIVSRDERFAVAAIAQLTDETITKTTPGRYSRVWLFALAYDWLYDHASLSAEKRAAIEAKIRERIDTELDLLDTRWAAVWHGRNQAANGVMIATLVLAGDRAMTRTLRRATAHWIDTLRALRFSEGWPEGASYWIYNRAVPYGLAADCFITATEADTVGGISIRDTLRGVGLWQLYQYGPNGVFEPYGDSAGSLRLGETGLWTVSADLFAKVSRDPAVAAAADFFRDRSPHPYGKRSLFWAAAVGYDPSARPTDDYDPAAPEVWMRRHLPQAMLFGRDSYGVAFFRGAWGSPGETFASFKAGDLLAHHDHYDVGNFTIQKGGNLVPQAGFYGDYTGKHRLGYQVQTVSANSLLILAPGEFSRTLRRREGWSALSGGQRVISPTGFDCTSVAHFKERLTSGSRLERATITAFESVPGRYDYVAADITAAYNSTWFAETGNAAKVSLVTRQFLYLRQEGAFVIFDRVDTTDGRFLPKFVLHSLSRPRTLNEKVLRGETSNGILESRDRVIHTADGSGRLTSWVLLPADARLLKIGGPDYCFYVESDGDQSDGFDGENLTSGSGRRGAERKADQWRTEIEPLEPGTSTRFLTVHVPRLAGQDQPVTEARLLESGPSTRAALIGDVIVVWADGFERLREATLPVRPAGLAVVLDAVPEGAYRVGDATIRASREGLLRLEQKPPDAVRIELVK